MVKNMKLWRELNFCWKKKAKKEKDEEEERNLKDKKVKTKEEKAEEIIEKQNQDLQDC